jgi:hypothetical protein
MLNLKLKDELTYILALLVIPNLIFYLIGIFFFSAREIVNIDYLFIALILLPFRKYGIKIPYFLVFLFLFFLDYFLFIGSSFHFENEKIFELVGSNFVDIKVISNVVNSFSAYSIFGQENSFYIGIVTLIIVYFVILLVIKKTNDNKYCFKKYIIFSAGYALILMLFYNYIISYIALILAILYLLSFTALFTYLLVSYSSKSIAKVSLKFVLLFILSLILVGYLLSDKSFSENKYIFSPSLIYLNFLTNSSNDDLPIATNVNSATKEIFDQLNNSQKTPSNIIIIISESWGRFKDDNLNNIILEPLGGKLKIGKINYTSSTLIGEVREVCGVLLDNNLPKNQDFLNYCLPNILKNKGYSTYAFNAHRLDFYKRNEWYSKAGFDNIYAKSSIISELENEEHLCGTGLVGICNKSLFRKIIPVKINQTKNAKNLIYILTLEGHVPIDPSKLSKNFQQKYCDNHPSLSKSPELCRYIEIQKNMINYAKNLYDSLDDAYLVIVGDHAPPFLKNSDRTETETKTVPYLIYEDKDIKDK